MRDKIAEMIHRVFFNKPSYIDITMFECELVADTIVDLFPSFDGIEEKLKQCGGWNLSVATAMEEFKDKRYLPVKESLDEWEVVRECPDCMGKGGRDDYYSPFGVGCFKCHSTGKIIRPLTMKDVDISKLINDVTNLNEQQLGLYTNKLHYLYNPLSLQTPDGGKVRRRGNK